MSFVSVEHLQKTYSGTPVFSDINFTISKGEFVTLLGPSGCGKSTLLRCIAGLTPVDDGKILLDGQDIVPLNPQKRGIGMVFQSYALFPNMTVEQNVAFGLRMQKVNANDSQKRVAEVLQLVELNDFAKRYPHQLSGGQCQRVALARSLVTRPRLLLLDEPLSALDARIRKHLREQIRQIQRELGLTTIFVTHDQEEALTLSDRIAVMSAGKILQIGTPTDIYEHPKHRFVAQFIGDINFLPGQLKHGEHNEKLFVPNGMPIEIPCQQQSFAGSSVQLAFRPERSQLVDASQPHHLRGVIEAVLYVGTATLYQCRLNNDIKVMLRENNEGLNPGRAVGERVAVHLPPHACLLMEA